MPRLRLSPQLGKQSLRPLLGPGHYFKHSSQALMQHETNSAVTQPGRLCHCSWPSCLSKRPAKRATENLCVNAFILRTRAEQLKFNLMNSLRDFPSVSETRMGTSTSHQTSGASRTTQVSDIHGFHFYIWLKRAPQNVNHFPRPELGPQQFFAWLVENKGTPKKQKRTKGS